MKTQDCACNPSLRLLHRDFIQSRLRIEEVFASDGKCRRREARITHRQLVTKPCIPDEYRAARMIQDYKIDLDLGR